MTILTYNPLNKVRIPKSLHIIISKQGRKESSYLTVECQIINLEKIRELENHHFATITEQLIQARITMNVKTSGTFDEEQATHNISNCLINTKRKKQQFFSKETWQTPH